MKRFFSNRFRKLFWIFTIIGPGLIAVNAGNEAGGIATYSQIGAAYGYNMLWALFLVAFCLAVVQEMNARMAVVTGKGLSDLIRESFGVKLTFFAMITMVVANFGIMVGDVAGIAASMELFSVSKYISVPIVIIGLWFLITKTTSYNRIEKIFLAFTFVFLTYIISAILAKPDWSEVFGTMISPSVDIIDLNYILLFIGLIGTTITPYMQFYLQASIVDKKLSLKDYKYEKLDVYLGSVWGFIVTFFIVVSTAATLYKQGILVESAQQAASALEPVAGEFASILFGFGLFGASLLACAIIPLSTAYAICEAFGWERGMDNTYKEAPVFYGIFTGFLLFSTLVVMIPNIPLIQLIIVTQQLAGILVPVILIFMIKLVNNKQIMGEYVNTPFQNSIAWITVLGIIALSVAIIFIPLFQN
jgi:NRAMP (natural resistance-associated macrophage protein)-like metal ion transporter